MKNYLATLNEREQRLVIIGGLCLLFYLYYFWLYTPLNQNKTQKLNQLYEKAETLEWMKHVNLQTRQTKLKKTLDSSELLTVISSELKQDAQLKFPYQLQQISSGDIQLSFDKVPFQFFLKWLDRLGKKYTIIIKQLDVDPIKTPGLTRLMIIIATAHSASSK